MIRLFTLSLSLFLFVIGCSDSTSPTSPDYDSSKVSFEDDSLHSGFVKIYSAGHYTYLGTDQKNVPVNERNSMKVLFDYDFSIARNEITRGEFVKVRGGSVSKDEENLPIANMSFGDVVLFANEKSKLEGYDTVYSYTGFSHDGDGHVIAFDNFAFNGDVEGYRLPTEAEWVFVASHGWKPSESWNSKNSDYKVHPVCTREPNELDVCDMAGNLAEWVNDWSGNLKDTTILNFVGSLDGGAINERIIKGGSYRSSSAGMKLYTRGDVYTVTASTMADYVGARLAFGPIENPTWYNGGTNASNSSLRSLVNGTTISAKLGNRRSKLAFVNGVSGNLAFVNYNENNFSVKEIVDTLMVRHPDISPDGEWVAFCTGTEGVSSKSELYVRRLNIAGADLVKLDVESAAIPRFSVTASGDTVIIYVNDAGSNKDSTSFAKTSTWQVPFSSGKFGTPKKLFDGAYHSGVDPELRLAVTGARLLRTRSAVKDNSILDDSAEESVWYNGEQACNASLSTDGTKRTLFLDFASKTGKEFVGSDYVVHGRMFVADSTGKLIQSVAAPSKYSFDHTEWVKNKDLAVASLSDANGVHSRIVLIQLKDSSITELIKGDDLMHPCMWTSDFQLPEKEQFLDLDSAGVYMTASSHATTVIMKIKMEMFWQSRESTEIAIVGSSRTFSGVDPMEITTGSSVNLSYSAEDLTATRYFIKNYFIPLMPKLKAIVLALDYDRLWVDDSNWKKWFGDIPGYKYDESHEFWKDGVPSSMYVLTKGALSPSEDDYFLSSYHSGLYHSMVEGYSEKNPEVAMDVDWFKKYSKEYSYNLETLEDILNLAEKKNIQVVGIVFPQSPLYSKLEAWGRYGLNDKDAKTIHGDMEKLAERYKNFTILDENKNGNHDYIYEDFANDDHLGLKGAVKLTRRLDSLLSTLLAK